ncbi:TetR family transcriptional regulator [Micromonospora soli]|uniref:TetR family transcriptional regulator n=1 Tax=Micromonospora sp. NBRC 110009 TaxID=3061627 RepID=UPI0026717C3C|nr:TetR family transcriptional regulator [Micromonospora sp. NBRC 110009]WKT97702.1 TetR family transcriptional regulator [Micromonospora sp. NBRC 110009]
MVHTGVGSAAPSRAQRKERTRQALLDAAVRLLADQGLSSLSLREVSRAAGIVPAAFYRHFADMGQLGVALAEQSLGGMRTAERMVRVGLTGGDELIEQSMAVLVDEVRRHPERYRFLARERFGGVAVVRRAIEDQLQRGADELAADLMRADLHATAGYLRDWPEADVRMATTLIADHMWQTAAALLDVVEHPVALAALRERATQQLRLIVVGCRNWPG